MEDGYIEYDQGLGPAERWWRIKILREFDLNASEVALAELGAYLKTRPDALYDLSWQQFERLTADVLKEHGMEVFHTQLSRDGGADVLILGQHGRIEGIVECKKWARTKKVGIASVHRLAGAAIDWGTRTAVLVSTTEFSRDAKRAAERLISRGIQMDLKGASEFLSLLDCYNINLPRLDTLTYEDRKSLIDEQTIQLKLGQE